MKIFVERKERTEGWEVITDHNMVDLRVVTHGRAITHWPTDNGSTDIRWFIKFESILGVETIRSLEPFELHPTFP